VHAADVDDDGETDAARRIAELTGEPLPEDDFDLGVEEDSPADAEGVDEGSAADDVEAEPAGPAVDTAEEGPGPDTPTSEPAETDPKPEPSDATGPVGGAGAEASDTEASDTEAAGSGLEGGADEERDRGASG
jgi:hypothetical protein